MVINNKFHPGLLKRGDDRSQLAAGRLSLMERTVDQRKARKKN